MTDTDPYDLTDFYEHEYPPPVESPCSECPWRYKSTRGWLGPHTPREWLRQAHGETAIACHKTIKESESWEGARQCAGAAAFRANVCKRPRNPSIADGPRRADVFQTNEEFMRHHTFDQEGWENSDMWGGRS